ncbi:RICIN domain-containing protein [Rubripirellula amarantea]|nr:RICIN domain-containing protein [Rubripirellula amarantea]
MFTATVFHGTKSYRRALKMGLFFVLVASVHSQGFAQDVISEKLAEQAEKFALETNELHQMMSAQFSKLENVAYQAGDSNQLALIQAEREEFTKRRILSPWLDAEFRSTYADRMSKNCALLQRVWEREIAKHHRRKDYGIANDLETKLGAMLISARGHGIALPSAAVLQQGDFAIQNVATGLVMDATKNSELILAAENPASKSQRFRFLLFDDSVAIRNLARKRVLDVPRGTREPGTRIIYWRGNGNSKNQKWKFAEEGRQLKITSLASDLVLTVETDVTNTVAFVEQQEDKSLPTQRWILVLKSR